jgi:hypothetical protein
VAQGGEGRGERQPDLRWEAHGGELTEAMATTAMAASKSVTPVVLRRRAWTRGKRGALGVARAHRRG